MTDPDLDLDLDLTDPDLGRRLAGLDLDDPDVTDPDLELDLDDEVLDDLLAGRSLPPGAAGRVRVVADALAGLGSPGDERELAAEGAARLAFSRAPGPGSRRRARGASRSRSRRARRTHVRAIAAMATLAAMIGGSTAAAYAGALPRPVQQFAHEVIGAPASLTSDPGKTASQVCAAYRRAAAGANARVRAAATRRLIQAAGSAARVAAYCAAAGVSAGIPQLPDGVPTLAPSPGTASTAVPHGQSPGHGGPGYAPKSSPAADGGNAGGNGHGKGNGNGKGNGKGNAGGSGNGNAGGNGNGGKH